MSEKKTIKKDGMTKRKEELIKKGFLNEDGNLTKKGVAYQEKLLIKYEQVFRLIVLISNQIIRQSQLVQILDDTNYAKSSNTISRMLIDCELFELIKRFKEEVTKFKAIQVTKTALKFVQGQSAVLVRTSGVIRETKNAIRVEMFRHYFLKEGIALKEALDIATQESVSTLFNSHYKFYDSLLANDLRVEMFRHYFLKEGIALKEALDIATQESVSTLFNSHYKFYDSLLANDLAFHSFNSKSSNFFLQKAEVEYVKQQQRQSLDKNLQRNGAKKENKINKDYRRCWTLEKLASHQIYLVDSYLSDPVASENNTWIDNHFGGIEGFKPKTLHLRFALATISTEPNKQQLVKALMNIYKYVLRTFKLHESYFIRNKGIKEAIVNAEVDIDVILLNDIALNNFNCADLEDWFRRKIRLRLRRNQMLESYKHNFHVNFLSMKVNRNNEHVSLEDNQEEDNTET